MNEEIGKKYGMRTVKEFRGYHAKGAIYLFECECGRLDELPLTELRNGRKTCCINCAQRKKRRDRMQAKGLWPKS